MPQTNTDKDKLIPQIGIRDTSTLSKLQQQFNAKIKKIHDLKASLTQTEVSMRLARERVQQELQPILGQITTHKIEMVKLLDRSYGLTFFRKKEKEKLAQLIEDMSYELIDNHGVEELIGLHDKYAQMTHAEATEMGDDLAKDLAQDLLKGMFGVDVEIKDFNDFEHIQAQIEQQLGEKEQQQNARKAARKKTEAQLAKEEKLKAEVANISKASRRIYTDLVKMLHPDREQDEDSRAWKEEAMKKVTQAYHHDDFFELLRLQVEFIQDRDRGLEMLSEEQLKYYVKMLNEQIKELKEEDYLIKHSDPTAGFYYQFCGDPKQINQKFAREQAVLKGQLTELQRDLREFEEDPKRLRTFLKQYKLDEGIDDFF